MNSPDNFLVVGAVLFALGAIGFLTRRNLILMMLSSELMLHGVSINLVAFSSARGNLQGQSFTVFILTIAACEAGLALALILALFRRRRTLDVGAWRDLGEKGQQGDKSEGRAAPVQTRLKIRLPRLTPAGRTPKKNVKQGQAPRESAGV